MGKIAQEDTQQSIKSILNGYYYGQDFFVQAEQGRVPDWSFVRKFGRIIACTTTLTPIAASGTYQMPTDAQSLEILSSSGNDAVGSTGATKVTVIGLNSVWQEITEEVSMNGITPVALTNKFIRVYRAYVSESGSYGNATTSSQVGTITLRGAAAGPTWISLILSGAYGLGQSLCGAYTVPAGYTAYVYAGAISVESNKTVTAYFFQRSNADDITTPYKGAVRVIATADCIGGFSDFGDTHSFGIFNEKTDIGWMANTSVGTANVSVEFKIYLKKNKS